MTFNEIYYAYRGIAYQKGLIEICRPRALNLFKGLCQVHKNLTFDYAIRLLLRASDKENIPCCKSVCPYRIPYEEVTKQQNQLRVEFFINAPFRCGWNLKDDRIGGRCDDYHPCTYTG